MRRGEVWWADLGPAARRRPVVLLSREEAYAIRALVTVAPVTTRLRNIPAEVELGLGDGLPRRCVVNLDTIATIARASLQERISLPGTDRMQAIDAAIHFALGLAT